MPRVLLHNVHDYKAGGLEFGEIITRLLDNLEDSSQVHIHHTEVPPLDTVALGFVTAQLALAECKLRKVIYGNAAPRRTSDKARKNNKDHGIKYARLDTGTEVINVNSPYAFGFLKSRIVEFRTIDSPDSGSQFRSRDFFPKRVAQLVNGDTSILTDELSIDDIPEIPNNIVTWTDGFGNIKTSMRKSDLASMGLEDGQKVQVILNDVSMLGVVSTGGFAVDRGMLAVNIGSSGYDNPFVELFLRVHHMGEKTAAVRFDYPEGGAEFELKAL
ncbi:SAM-dependent chlorinase/fluorinase [Candidatus Woesebacteria bacterium]|nr:SAM-dependent chlorinase/fluorinase [Candidatus Woesebacteria bacterium]